MLVHKISKKALTVAIESLKKYSSDFDGLNKFVLKKIQFAVVWTPTYLVNKCFENTVFRICSKKAVIIRLHKNGDHKVDEN